MTLGPAVLFVTITVNAARSPMSGIVIVNVSPGDGFGT